jgi:hypothetical protein
MSVEDFLRSKGLNPNDMVIYNMHNISNPKIPLIQWLKEFEKIIREENIPS